MRLAQRFGYNDVAQMCSDVSRAVGDRISVTDLILWRFEERSYALSVRRDPGGPPMALSVAPAAIHPNAMFLRGLQASVRVVANGVRASSASRRPTNRVLGAREEKASV
jgi:hypothetical protein